MAYNRPLYDTSLLDINNNIPFTIHVCLAFCIKAWNFLNKVKKNAKKHLVIVIFIFKYDQNAYPKETFYVAFDMFIVPEAHKVTISPELSYLCLLYMHMY